MLNAPIRIAVPALALALAVTAPVAGAERRQEAVPAPRPAAATPVNVALAQDATETRDQFEAILRRLPPSVGRVIKTDPSLMKTPAYLATYPALGAFLEQHPDIVNNAGYYLQNIAVPSYSVPEPTNAAVALWNRILNSLVQLIIFAVIGGSLVWLVALVLRHRRWQRTFKAQTDMQNKMVDRLSANEDLMAYLQSPQARWVVEMDQPLAEARPLPPANPFGRILWAVQAGLVLSAAAVGLIFISRRVIEEVAQVFFAVGVLALAVGIGFVVSAAVSFLLSQRLGLIVTPRPGEHSGTSRA